MELNYYSQDIDYSFENTEIINALIKSVLIAEVKNGDSVSIIFTSEKNIISLNEQYLNRNYGTDIIAFDYSENEIISGDLFICIPVVQSNSATYDVSFEEELMRVIIHGILHLCGYADKTDDEKELMRYKEDKYLKPYKSIA